MIHITIRTILTFKKILDAGEIDLSIPENTTLSDVLHFLVEKYGPRLATELFDDDGNLYQHVRIMVNGRDYSFIEKQMDTHIQDGDEILILPPVGGG